MEISDLEHRLQSLEPLRQQAGAVRKIGTLLRLGMTRMGGMLVLALVLSMGAAWAGLDGEQIAPWAMLAAAGGFVVPTPAGLAWVRPATLLARLPGALAVLAVLARALDESGPA